MGRCRYFRYSRDFRLDEKAGLLAANPARVAQDLARLVADIRAAGHVSLRAIAAALEARGMRTRRGGAGQVSSVWELLRRLDRR